MRDGLAVQGFGVLGALGQSMQSHELIKDP